MSIKTNEAYGFVLWLDSQLLNNLLPLTESFPLTGAFIMSLLWFLWCLIKAEFVLQSFLTEETDTVSLLCTVSQSLYKNSVSLRQLPLCQTAETGPQFQKLLD